MSVTSGFFNSLNGDRRYTAEQFSELMDGLINDGVFANIGSAFAVNAATGNGITIGIGRAWFNGTWLYNDAILPMNVRASEALVDRIDALVIEINRSDAVRAGNIMFVYGEPSNTPVRPTLTNTDEIHQYPLAYIYRSAGATSVSQADIENMVGTSACPFVTGILEVVDVDQLLTQWNTQFGNWFDNLQITLSGDVAANLANQILELQSQFDTLAKEKAVYSVLLDSTGEAIRDNNNGEIMGKTVVGGDGNSTVNIEGDTYQIGDTLTTARTDLGERWLLCNGEAFTPGTYPRLAELLSPIFSMRDRTIVDEVFYPQVDVSCNYAFLYRTTAKRIQGYDVVLKPYVNGTTRQTYLYYKTATDNSDEWTRKIVSSFYALDIAYYNNRFVLSGSEWDWTGTTSSSYEYPAIAYSASSSSLDTTWTTVRLASGSTGRNNRVSTMAITEDEIYVAFNNYLYYATNELSSWTSRTFTSTAGIGLDGEQSPKDLFFIDGYFYYAIQAYDASFNQGYGQGILRLSKEDMTHSIIGNVVDQKNYRLFVLKNRLYYTYGNTINLINTTEGTVEKRIIVDDGRLSYIHAAFEDDSYVYFLGGTYPTSDDYRPSNAQSVIVRVDVDLLNYNVIGYPELDGAAECFSGVIYDETNQKLMAPLSEAYFYTTGDLRLPEVSSSDLYTYIKAQE